MFVFFLTQFFLFLIQVLGLTHYLLPAGYLGTTLSVVDYLLLDIAFGLVCYICVQFDIAFDLQLVALFF